MLKIRAEDVHAILAARVKAAERHYDPLTGEKHYYAYAETVAGIREAAEALAALQASERAGFPGVVEVNLGIKRT